MRSRFGFAAFCCTVLGFGASPLAAQSDILLKLQTASQERLRVDTAGGLYIAANTAAGITTPFSGTGTRLIFNPLSGSFRAGYITGSQWDHANLGQYSWAGGRNSIASGSHSLAFGDSAVASSDASVSLGLHTVASGASSVALGQGSSATNQAAFAAGMGAHASGLYSIAMGYSAHATGTNAIALGDAATASGSYSLAVGYHTSTKGFQGAVVIGDGSFISDSTEATANNQFTVRAAGGYRLYSNAGETSGLQMAAGASAWSIFSDRNRKQDFLEVDGEDLLARLRSVPVTSWRYRAEEDRTVRHIGPMAQDWEAAFGFSHDTTMINTGDLDGVNLAGVKALEARTRQQAARIGQQDARIAEQAERIGALDAQVREHGERMRALEAELARLRELVAGREPGSPKK